MLFLFALFMATLGGAGEPSPDAVVHAFYRQVLADTSPGLPLPDERASLADLVAPELLQLLARASDTEARCIAAAPPDDKPLIIEGDIFTGSHEGATEVAYGEAVVAEGAARIDNTLLYIDPRFAKAHKFRAVAWRNTVELHREGDRWVIDDIIFAGHGSLVADLQHYLAEGKSSCATL